jgi:hypothetical protein
MANLSGQNIGTNYKGILNLGSTINTALSGTLQAITDGDGNASLLQLSTTQVNVGGGTHAAALVVMGDGTNDIIALRNGANTATRFRVDNDGNCFGLDGIFCGYAGFGSGSNGIKIGSGLRIKNPVDGEMLLQNDSANDFFKIHFGTTSKPAVCQGAGTPEGAVTAPIGSIFMRSDGSTGTSFYVKESGTGNTGWIAK